MTTKVYGFCDAGCRYEVVSKEELYGKIGETLGLAFFECGSYVGTGTFGVDSPTTITVDGKPMFLVLQAQGDPNSTSFVGGNSIHSGNSDNTNTFISVDWGNNYVSIINHNTTGYNATAGYQYNELGRTYFYVVLYI